MLLRICGVQIGVIRSDIGIGMAGIRFEEENRQKRAVYKVKMLDLKSINVL